MSSSSSFKISGTITNLTIQYELNSLHFPTRQATIASIKASPTPPAKLAQTEQVLTALTQTQDRSKEEKSSFFALLQDLGPAITSEQLETWKTQVGLKKSEKRDKRGEAFSHIENVLVSERGIAFTVWLKDEWVYSSEGNLNTLARLCEVLEGDAREVVRLLNGAMMCRLMVGRAQRTLGYTTADVKMALDWGVGDGDIWTFSEVDVEDWRVQYRSLGQLVDGDGEVCDVMSFADEEGANGKLWNGDKISASETFRTIPEAGKSKLNMGDDVSGLGKRKSVASEQEADLPPTRISKR